MKKRFGVLRILATIMKILGIITAALAVLGGLGMFIFSVAGGGNMLSYYGIDAASGAVAGLLSGFMIIFLGALYAAFIYGYGELLMLFVSMEDNTHRTVKLLEEVISEDKPE